MPDLLRSAAIWEAPLRLAGGATNTGAGLPPHRSKAPAGFPGARDGGSDVESGRVLAAALVDATAEDLVVTRGADALGGACWRPAETLRASTKDATSALVSSGSPSGCAFVGPDSPSGSASAVLAAPVCGCEGRKPLNSAIPKSDCANEDLARRSEVAARTVVSCVMALCLRGGRTVEPASRWGIEAKTVGSMEKLACRVQKVCIAAWTSVVAANMRATMARTR